MDMFLIDKLKKQVHAFRKEVTMWENRNTYRKSEEILGAIKARVGADRFDVEQEVQETGIHSHRIAWYK